MSDFYSNVNTAVLVFGLISGCLFIVSELLGFFNKYSPSCTSISEFILKGLKVIREPTLDERLAYLQNERLNRIS